jgi:hypothetical protein
VTVTVAVAASVPAMIGSRSSAGHHELIPNRVTILITSVVEVLATLEASVTARVTTILSVTYPDFDQLCSDLKEMRDGQVD